MSGSLKAAIRSALLSADPRAKVMAARDAARFFESQTVDFFISFTDS